MPLTCPTDLTGVDQSFIEFIDCDSVSININNLGAATVTFTVIAVNSTPVSTAVYTDLTFGGVNFTGFISDLQVSQIPGTLVYQHGYTLKGVGCKV